MAWPTLRRPWPPKPSICGWSAGRVLPTPYLARIVCLYPLHRQLADVREKTLCHNANCTSALFSHDCAWIAQGPCSSNTCKAWPSVLLKCLQDWVANSVVRYGHRLYLVCCPSDATELDSGKAGVPGNDILKNNRTHAPEIKGRLSAI